MCYSTVHLLIISLFLQIWSTSSSTVVTLVNGLATLPDGTTRHVGTYASEIQSFIDTYYEPIDQSAMKSTTFYNSSVLRYRE